jgi:hypothetical protein
MQTRKRSTLTLNPKEPLSLVALERVCVARLFHFCYVSDILERGNRIWQGSAMIVKQEQSNLGDGT